MNSLKLIQYFYLTFILLFLGGCTTVKVSPVVRTSVKAKPMLKKVCKENNISLQWDSILQVANLQYAHNKAKVMVGSRIALLNDKVIVMSSPVEVKKSVCYVGNDFKDKVIDQMIFDPTGLADYSLVYFKKVIIDAGHGGKDPGTIGKSGLEEKKVTLDIAKRVKKILKRNGLQVVMTRKKDEFISLKNRTEISSREGADLFISIHANSSPAKSVHGLEVFTLKQLGRKERKEEQRVRNQKIKYKHLSMIQNNRLLENILNDMMYVHKQAVSREVARQTGEKTAKFIKARNRGLKHARFFVLRNTLIPSILVEVGFLSNYREEKYLKSGAYRQKIAYGIARSILDYAK